MKQIRCGELAQAGRICARGSAPLLTDGNDYEPRDRQAGGQVEAHAAADGRCAAVWDHVIHGLLPEGPGGGPGGGPGENSREARGAAGKLSASARRPRMAAYAPSSHIQVEVTERLSATSVAVLWQDATRCRYDDQVWISCRARLKGYCVVSGAVIRRDDRIYKPRVRTATPANAAAMILASVIERMPAKAAAAERR